MREEERRKPNQTENMINKENEKKKRLRFNRTAKEKYRKGEK